MGGGVNVGTSDPKSLTITMGGRGVNLGKLGNLRFKVLNNFLLFFGWRRVFLVTVDFEHKIPPKLAPASQIVSHTLCVYTLINRTSSTNVSDRYYL